MITSRMHVFDFTCSLSTLARQRSKVPSIDDFRWRPRIRAASLETIARNAVAGYMYLREFAARTEASLTHVRLFHEPSFGSATV